MPASPHTPEPPASQPAPSGRLDAVLWLLGVAAILLAALVLEVRAGELIGLPGLASMPEICSLKRSFCLKCPGCGLTRSFIHMAHGDLAAAYRTNWVGIAAFLFTIFQLPIALASLVRRGGRRLAVIYRWNARLLALLGLLLLIRWACLLYLGELYAHA